MLTLYISSDHRGFELKSELLQYYSKLNTIKVVGIAPNILKPDDDFVDYAIDLAKFMKNNTSSKAILICGNGVGMCIAANRYRFLRAVNSDDVDIIREAREHNDCNVLCLAADKLTLAQSINLIDVFLSTQPILEERYLRRINKLGSIDNE